MPDPNRPHRLVAVESRPLREGVSWDVLIGRSAAIVELRELVVRVAAADSPVLITGEAGTGKRSVARIIHRESRRRDEAFVSLACGPASPEARDEETLEARSDDGLDLFERHRGAFVDAHRGTLFLDEVADMPAPLQTRMLGVLKSGELRAIGSDDVRHVDVRCVAATATDLQAQVDGGAFREDLFFRLNVLPIRIPPLRERRQDIPLLVAHLLTRFAPQGGARPAPTFTSGAMNVLEDHAWPGNLRELAELVDRLVATSAGRPIDADAVRAGLAPAPPSDLVQALVAARLSLEALEALYIGGVLRHTHGNKTRAAEILGIDPSTLYRRVKHRPS